MVRVQRAKNLTVPGTLGLGNGVISGHQHCCLYIFLIMATHRDWKLICSTKVPLELGLGLGFREPQSLQPQGHWFWKRHAKRIMTGHQHGCLNIIPVWATLGDGAAPKHYSVLHWVQRVRKPTVMGHWGWKRHAKGIIAGPQHCCPYIFLIWAIHRTIQFGKKTKSNH